MRLDHRATERIGHWGWGVAAVLLMLATPSAPAGLANVPAEADAFIMSELGNNNGGGHIDVAAGATRFGDVRRSLLRFDLGFVPAGSTITSTVVRIQVTKLPFFATPQHSNFDLFRMLAAWWEGTKIGGTGALASTAEVTWNNRAHPATPWTAPGAASDAAASPSATTFVSGLGIYAWTGSGLVADVQGWIDDPASNYGWLLKSQAEGTLATAKRFGAREGGTAAVLEIGFVSPPPPDVAVQQLSADTNGVLTLGWTGAPGWQYDLIADDDLADSNDFVLAQVNIPDSGNGTNELNDLPLRVNPAVPGNDHLVYAVQARPDTRPPLPVVLDPVATNLVSPVVLTHAGDGSGRLFIAEQTGQILIVDTNQAVLAQPFLDLSANFTDLNPIGIGGVTNAGLNPIFDERGLLGLAFHSQYPSNGLFYVYYSSPKTGPGIDHESIVSEFQVSAGDPNLADPSSERVVLRQDQPEFNHNAGQLAFGPDGYLYIAFGDGGGGGDQHGAIGNAQDTSNWLGSILRIDVDGAPPYAVPPDNPFVGGGGLPEIYAYGLRNPFRFSFDRGGSNTFIVADVGQNLYEEINFVAKGGNYGWRIAEGLHGFDIPLAGTLGVDVWMDLGYPIHQYSHAEAGITVIGGFMYRGANYPELKGRYVFGDFSDQFGAPGGRLYYLEETRPGIWERFQFTFHPGNPPLGRFVKALGEDEDGEVYLLTSTVLGPTGTGGEVLKLARP